MMIQHYYIHADNTGPLAQWVEFLPLAWKIGFNPRSSHTKN